MQQDTLSYQSTALDVGVYECEVHLKFRLVEERGVLTNRDQLLEMLLDAFTCGSDEFMEPLQVEVNACEISEMTASPEMRRQLIRLRNSKDCL
ncbi:MAG: Npun_R1517 family heterocyst differentiation transcriptional regulator [Synechococcales bacterium]|nr:Npun_R1517 family heterocyst differentiation transcriptional regulator [Synechococcales bacterium]